MLEFEDFVYLDVQKTGSTTVRRFLMKHGRGKIVNSDKHMPVVAKDPDKTYFISCRDPLSQYISLYSYGHGRLPTGGLRRERGSIYSYLSRGGQAELYDGTPEGFVAWMKLMLDPAFGREAFAGHDRHRLLNVVGLQSLRFLTLNLPSPRRVMAPLRSPEDISAALEGRGAADVILRTETLSEQLGLMCDGAYGDIIADPTAARLYLASEPPRNESVDLGLRPETLPPSLIKQVEAREWLYFQHLGYQPYRRSDADD